MENISKDRITGIVGTLLFHTVLLVLLCLLVMAAPPRQEESGVPVVLGNVEDAFGSELAMTDVEIIPQPEVSQQLPSSDDVSQEEPLLIQDIEESIAVPAKKETKSAKEIEAERRAAEEAERKRIEKETKAKADNLIAGAFGKGNSMSSKGNSSDGEGTQGSKDGNSSAGKTTGVGGTGVFDLNGRSLSPAGLPKPRYNVQEEGRVVVTITVNPQGNVVKASINSRTNTSSPALRKAALDAAKKATFNAVSQLDDQEGTITYYFKLK